jgi:dihydroneopterin aldolase
VPPPDRILLDAIEVEALIGVHEWERRAKRPLVVDLELACDLADAAATDRLETTVDYFELTRRVKEACAASTYRLVEALAGEIARICLAEARVAAVKVTVRKPGAVEGVGGVAVVLERRRLSS